MNICQERDTPHKLLFFIRWQLWPVLLALPGHGMFVGRGLGDATCGLWRRLLLACQLIRVHLMLPCAHSPMEILHIIEEIITLPATTVGAVVECGTYLGGSTAKLSLAVAAVKRRLIVCDSFQGLPAVRPADSVAGKEAFQAGDFLSSLECVRDNVRRYGNIAVVDFVPGWYHESLSRLLGIRAACVFLDVDLQASIKTCLSALWGTVEPGCKVFVHDVDRPPVVAPFRDQHWWVSHVGPNLPKFVGDGTGLGWQKPLLGYAIKS